MTLNYDGRLQPQLGKARCSIQFLWGCCMFANRAYYHLDEVIWHHHRHRLTMLTAHLHLGHQPFPWLGASHVWQDHGDSAVLSWWYIPSVLWAKLGKSCCHWEPALGTQLPWHLPLRDLFQAFAGALSSFDCHCLGVLVC